MAYPMEKKLLTPSQWARPQSKLKGVDGIVWHWVANPNSTAMDNRNFFNNRTGSYGSTQYIIDLDGKQYQLIPDNEMAYAVGSHVYTQRALRELGSYPNNNTLNVECTHLDWNGKMTEETYDSLIDWSVTKLKQYNLTVDDIWLHQEVVGWKDCHRFFVNNLNEYKKAKEDVAKKMSQSVKNPPKAVNPKEDTDMVRTDSDGFYTVQKGDTLWAIAQAFDTSVATLEKLNPSVKVKALQIGSKIKIGSASNPKPSNSKAKLKVDGYWGREVTKALQRYFGTPIDGEIWGQIRNSVTSKITGGIKYGKGGSTVIKALQKLVGAVADGILGKDTIRKLQAYLGTPVDGELWNPSTVVKELQRRLNAGTF